MFGRAEKLKNAVKSQFLRMTKNADKAKTLEGKSGKLGEPWQTVKGAAMWL